MRVSIVIPTYQRAGFVETAIESVLGQREVDVEVIAIDDGSTDGTDAVLARIAERSDPDRFRWWRHDNVGQSETINRGFAEARGELLGYLSSDDYLLPGALARLTEVATQHPDADVVYPWCDVIDEADRRIDTLELPEHTLVDALRWGACMIGSGALVRRRYVDRVGGWDPTLPTCPDFDWWIRGGDARFVRVPERLAVWRRHDDSLTTSSDAREKLASHLRMLDRVFADPDLPAEIAAVRDEAYGAAMVAGGLEIAAGSELSRFVIWDRLSASMSTRGQESAQHGIAAYAMAREMAEHRARTAETVAERRDQSLAALAAVAEHQSARIAGLTEELAVAHATVERLVARERQLVAPPAPPEELAVPTAPPDEPRTPSRPLWLRLGRRITPPALRHRVGVAVHRIGGAR